jgi:hypothetical protein
MIRPAHFYKFCTARVARLNLSKRIFRFSSPLRFNDPFDCYFAPTFSNLRHRVASFEKRHQAILTSEEVLKTDTHRAGANKAPHQDLIARVHDGVFSMLAGISYPP